MRTLQLHTADCNKAVLIIPCTTFVNSPLASLFRFVHVRYCARLTVPIKVIPYESRRNVLNLHNSVTYTNSCRKLVAEITCMPLIIVNSVLQLSKWQAIVSFCFPNRASSRILARQLQLSTTLHTRKQLSDSSLQIALHTVFNLLTHSNCILLLSGGSKSR